MFTGIIEEIGFIRSLRHGSRSILLEVEGHKIFEDMKIGCSIAVNGVCLTVTSFKGRSFTADVMPETVTMTALRKLDSGSNVNLERAMPANGRFDGHMVAGHVDGIGIVSNIKKDDNSIVFTLQAPAEVMQFIVYKGSVALNGISLTVSEETATSFNVSIIPHSLQETTLQYLKIGSEVNIETDIAGRYIHKFMLAGIGSDIKKNNSRAQDKTENNSGLTKEFLVSRGFL